MKREAFISLKAPFATRLPEAVRGAGDEACWRGGGVRLYVVVGIRQTEH